MHNQNKQLDLFAQITGIYADAGISGQHGMTNASLYESLIARKAIDSAEIMEKAKVGKVGAPYSLGKRKVRWYQQSLKSLGIIERCPEVRGVWQLTEAAGRKLHRPAEGIRLLGFSTSLGVAIWGACNSVFADINEPITLCVTSPPYPLRTARDYGNVAVSEYVDFICKAMDLIVKNLIPGGCIALNVSNDIFETKSPARSLYRERLVLALCDRLGLFKMDELIWKNFSKPPGPIEWASKKRYQLNVAWEPIYIFTNDPMKCKANNRRVLEAHTKRHLDLIAKGGEKRDESYCDGAYRIKPGSFGTETAGKIPRNVLEYGHSCSDSNQYRADARRLGLPVHGAAVVPSEYFLV